MIQPDQFDAFYKVARTRLLLQTYALTGDLPAARSAVRDSFVVTWHHWRKVSRLPDPESWVRPLAWGQAHRRHTARIWHRDKQLAADAKATFAALGKLSYSQRKTLLLAQLTDLPAAERARELGVPRAEADRQLQVATEKFVAQREVAADQVPALFEELGALVADTSWPRSSIIRRSGASRRRWHTLVGAAAAVAALVVSGTAVSVTPTDTTPGDVPAAPAAGEPPPPAPAFDADRLLESDTVRLALGGRRWREGRTTDNAQGDGMVTPCQRARYADSKGLAALVRRFQSEPRRSEPPASAVQVAELSDDAAAARRTWQRTVEWYAGCTAPRVQLLATYDVHGIGHQAMLVHLHDWRDGATYLAGVARNGEVTTTTFLRTPAGPEPDLRGGARLLGEAVERLCGAAEAARCAPSDPRLQAVAPPEVGEVPGMLTEVDLPPVQEVRDPWVGTEPRQARDNAAATRCDQTDFSQRPVSHAITRTFLIPGARLPAAFGLTETVGTLPEGQARAFMARIRDRIRTCPDRDPGSEVTALASETGPERDLTIWRVTSELNDQQAVTYWMGVVRVGTAVGQVGFVPGPEAALDPADFDRLVRRARARLAYLPRPRP